ncbi:MAG: hypothetical protein ACI4Q8_02620 [Ruminococcus sp.]
MTNFEKIKQMSVEEMSEELFHIVDCDDTCPVYKDRDFSEPTCNIIGCKRVLKKWLESEVE